ncbi:MAG TPA: carboxymuconolactone decarboxylase [Rhodospirillaceae bacterium]|nr:carboxymuconolactone decarboxylase [Rhodospirillaceae bacterium]HAT36088.1 carboxymuconolactone decarboxylase [Rhodospirillaceae bacterium]
MARLSYLDGSDDPAVSELIEAIKAKRGGTLPYLFGLLLHSPEIAEAWFGFMSATRGASILNGQVREIVILHVAGLMGAEYPINDHIPIALGEGLSQAKIDAVPTWRGSDLFDAPERAVLAYVEAMTNDVQVGDEIMSDLKAHFSEREIVELTVLSGAYNMVGRFLEALEVDLEPT